MSDDAAEDEIKERPWLHLHDLVESDDSEELEGFVATLSSGDAARALAHLTGEDCEALLTALEPERAADLVEILPDVQAAELIEGLEPEAAAEIVCELPRSEGADLLNEMGSAEAEALLDELPRPTADQLRALRSYPEDVAGGLMIKEFLAFRAGHHLADVVQDLRRNAKRYRRFDIQYAYVTDEEDRIVGVLPFRQLLLADPEAKVGDLVLGNALSVQASTPLSDLAEIFDRHPFYGLPVLEGEELVGVLRRADVEEAQIDRSERDHLKSQGIVGGEELRSMGLRTRSGRRLSWLSVNIVLNLAAASVIAAFEDTLSSVIALAVFLPMISDMSGCSGNQAVAVSMRELTLGLIKPMDLLHVWLKEILVGVVNGLVLGALLGLIALFWKGNLWLALVVGVSLALNTVVAVSLGGCVPLVLKRFGMDPALASGPILTTITDLCGFVLVLGFASLVMTQILAG